MKIYNSHDGSPQEIPGMYLWCNPDMPHWVRLLLGPFYLSVLFWWWLTGKPLVLGWR